MPQGILYFFFSLKIERPFTSATHMYAQIHTHRKTRSVSVSQLLSYEKREKKLENDDNNNKIIL